eukprot:6659059-Pyramimonas_sp.AAC.1
MRNTAWPQEAAERSPDPQKGRGIWGQIRQGAPNKHGSPMVRWEPCWDRLWPSQAVFGCCWCCLRCFLGRDLGASGG